jgi:hypothetical protein
MESVTLPYQSLVIASTAAAMRQAKTIRSGRVGHDHGSTSDRQISRRLADGVLGELGEKAVSKRIDRHQTRGSGAPAPGDVGDEEEVRATEYDGGHLLVYDKDADDARFFLAVVSFDDDITVSLPGWILGADAKQKQYKRDSDPPCYWVPQSGLNPLSSLSK